LAGAPFPKDKEAVKLVSGKRNALKAAIDAYDNGTWKPITHPAAN
jgi:hypothetical protein